jgi:hypothetical protein
MPDFSVTGIVTIDNTDSILSIEEVEQKADKAAQKIMMMRRKALSTLSMVNGMISQAYGSIKGVLKYADVAISPVFDALFSTISAIVSTALAAAVMMMSSLHPALVTIGVALMVVSLELNLRAQMDLEEARKEVKNSIYSVPDYAQQQVDPFWFRRPEGGVF